MKAPLSGTVHSLEHRTGTDSGYEASDFVAVNGEPVDIEWQDAPDSVPARRVGLDMEL